MKILECSTSQISDLFEIDRSTLTRWKDAGMPGYIRRGKWNLKEMIGWWLANIYQGGEPDTEDITASKERYWSARADRERMRADLDAGQLLPREAVSAAWAARVTEVCSGLGILVDRLPPLLAGLDRDAMRDLIEEEVFRLRDSYARGGKYCPQEEQQ